MAPVARAGECALSSYQRASHSAGELALQPDEMPAPQGGSDSREDPPCPAPPDQLAPRRGGRELVPQSMPPERHLGFAEEQDDILAVPNPTSRERRRPVSACELQIERAPHEATRRPRDLGGLGWVREADEAAVALVAGVRTIRAARSGCGRSHLETCYADAVDRLRPARRDDDQQRDDQQAHPVHVFRSATARAVRASRWALLPPVDRRPRARQALADDTDHRIDAIAILVERLDSHAIERWRFDCAAECDPSEDKALSADVAA